MMPQYVGVGLYSISQAARIIRVKPTTLRTWVRGYTYQTRYAERRQSPVVHRFFGHPIEPLTFLELIELLFVKLFRVHGVSMQTVRRAAEAACELFGTKYPFAVKRFDTDGKRIFASLVDEATLQNAPSRVIEELGKGQIVFEPFVRPFFRHIDYLESLVGEARRYWPPEGNGRVVLDPGRSFGRPIDAETGVPTEALYDAFLASGRSTQSAANWYEVPIPAVESAVRFEGTLLAA